MDTTVNALGFSYAEAFTALKQRADAARAKAVTYSVNIPNPNGVGSVPWSYTFSSTPPPPHDNNPDYPPWTQMARAIQAAMEAQTFAYAVTGDATYLRSVAGTGAVDMALALAQWPRWTDVQMVAKCCCLANSKHMTTCLDTSQLSQGVAFLYDVAFPVLSSQERSTIRSALMDKGVVPMATDLRNILAQPSAVAPNYWALRTTAIATGAAALLKEGGTPASDLAKLAHGSFEQWIASQGNDGGTFEGQMYGAYAVDNLVAGADALRRAGVGDLFASPWLSQIQRFVNPFWSSDIKTLANFGDSYEMAFWQNTLFALAHRGNAEAQWGLFASKQIKPTNFHQFIWSNPALAPVAPAGSGSAVFPDVGHAALRAGYGGAPVVAFKSQPPSLAVGHNQFDANSFIINIKGAWVAADPGYRDYFYAPANRFTTGSVGHNTVLADASISSDGSAFSGGQTSLVGAQMGPVFDGAGYGSLIGHGAAAYAPALLQKFDRRILYAKPDLAFVLDDLAAPVARSFSFLLHSGADGTIVPSGGEATVSRRGRGRLESFVHASAPVVRSVKSYPNAAAYGPYAEWKTTAVTDAKFVAALVFGSTVQPQLLNTGFEEGLLSWVAYSVPGSIGIDASASRSGLKSVKLSLPSVGSGYVRAVALDVAPGAGLEAASYFATNSASGTVKLQVFYVKDGVFTGGPQTSVSVSGTQGWTQISTAGSAPSEFNQMTLVASFSGTGTVWFDDLSLMPSFLPQEPSMASVVRLGEAGSGLVVSGPFGTELIGRGESGQLTIAAPGVDGFGGVYHVSADGDLFAAGIDAQGNLRRALLMAGSTLSLNGDVLFSAEGVTTADLAMVDGTLTVTEAAPRTAATFRVRAAPSQVILDGKSVHFKQEGALVHFPAEPDSATAGGPATPAGGCGGCGGQDATLSLALLVGLGGIRPLSRRR